MIKHLFTFCISTILFCCAKTKETNRNKLSLEQTKDSIIKSSEPLLEIRIKKKDRKIEIVQKGSIKLPKSFISYLKVSIKECPQCYDFSIDTTCNISLFNNNKSSYPIIQMDWNLDGYIDLAIPTWYSCCLGHNVAYKYWITDSTEFNFIEDTIISNIPNIEINTKEKKIYGTFTSGINNVSTFEFKIKNGKIIPLNSDYIKFQNEN